MMNVRFLLPIISILGIFLYIGFLKNQIITTKMELDSLKMANSSLYQSLEDLNKTYNKNEEVLKNTADLKDNLRTEMSRIKREIYKGKIDDKKSLNVDTANVILDRLRTQNTYTKDRKTKNSQ